MWTRRRKLALVSLATCAGLLFLAWFWVAPLMVRSRIEATLSSRLGREVQVEDVDLRWRGFVANGVSVEGDGVYGRIEAVGVQGSLFGLARRGASAIEHVQARGGAVIVDLESLVMPERAEGSGRGGSAERVVELVDIGVQVNDAEGELAEGRLNARWDGRVLLLGARDARLGASPANTVSVERVEVSLRRSPHWAVERAEVEGAHVELAEEGHVTRERIARARAVVAPTGVTADASDAQSEHDDLLSRLVDGAVLELVRGEVVRSDGELALDSLAATIRREGEVLHLEGSGGGAGGSGEWSFRVRPRELSGEGSLQVEELPFDLLVPFLPDFPWFRPGDARIAASLDIVAASPERLTMNGSLSVRDLAFSDERIAPRPVGGIGFTIEGAASLRPMLGELEVSEAIVRMGGAELRGSGFLARDDEHWAVRVEASLPATDCNDAVSAVPADLLAEVAGFSWQGRIGGRLRLNLRSDALEDTVLQIHVANGCRFETVPAMADLRRVRGSFLHRVQEPDGDVFEMTSGPGSANWVPIAAMSPLFIQAVVGHEDGGFFNHGGFAVYAIRDALVRNVREGRYVVGASTITMQLAKNLFLHREKTLARKVQEVFLTWWLENALSKAEILELYFNVIEYGPEIYGILRASEHYFGRAPVELSAAESAFLATILPNPKAYHDSYEQGALGTRMRSRIARFIEHLGSRGRFDSVAVADGLAELEQFRFARPGEPAVSWPARGGAAALPFATSMPADEFEEGWGGEGDPEADPYESFPFEDEDDMPNSSDG